MAESILYAAEDFNLSSFKRFITKSFPDWKIKIIDNRLLVEISDDEYFYACVDDNSLLKKEDAFEENRKYYAFYRDILKSDVMCEITFHYNLTGLPFVREATEKLSKNYAVVKYAPSHFE